MGDSKTMTSRGLLVLVWVALTGVLGEYVNVNEELPECRDGDVKCYTQTGCRAWSRPCHRRARLLLRNWTGKPQRPRESLCYVCTSRRRRGATGVVPPRKLLRPRLGRSKGRKGRDGVVSEGGGPGPPACLCRVQRGLAAVQWPGRRNGQ